MTKEWNKAGGNEKKNKIKCKIVVPTHHYKQESNIIIIKMRKENKMKN